MQKPRFDDDSNAVYILNMIHMTGELPYRCLKIMGNSSCVMQRTARQLVEHGYLKITKVNKERTLLRSKNVKDYADKLFLNAKEIYKDRVQETYFVNSGVGSKTRRERNMRVSETVVFMNESGMEVYPDRKPDMSKREQIPADKAYFFTSREMKGGMVMEAKRASASRCSGFLITPMNCYMVYCIGSKLVKIGESTEKGTRDRVEGVLNQLTEIAKNGQIVYLENAIVLTTSYESILKKLIDRKSRYCPSEGYKRVPVFEIDDTFQNYYLIPFTREGSLLLRMIIEPAGEQILRNLAIPQKERTGALEVDCDGLSDEKEFLFVFFVPNIKRLKRFLNSASRRREDRFIVYCFTFQEPGLKEIISSNVQIVPFEMDKVVELYEARRERGII